MIEPALQVRVMAAVLAFDDTFGDVQGTFIDATVGQHGHQQIKHLALVSRGRFDHKGRVGAAGEGVPLSAQGLHALLEPPFPLIIDAAEQKMFEQVR